jgi:uncharacterized membrane protein SpoIIM required for sporulation
MRERNFISQNKEKWKELEELLNDERKDPDKLSRLFVQVTDDLSYARTFYPNRFVRVYLNSIAQKLFYLFYKNKTTGKNRFVYYWKEELPKLIYSARRELFFSFIVFLTAFTIGVVSTAHNTEFATAILGKNYVNTTLENIKKGDPMAIYKDPLKMDMYLKITMNNLIVSFFAFIGGLFFGIGSFGVVLYNGIMIGVFQYFFYRHGLFMTSALTIWLHGTLEIASMIIACAAGITMGKGIIFPGTYTRLQAFFLSSRKGLKILLGILPLIIIAALIESFITRHTEAPAWEKISVIATSLGFIIFYFIVYPYLVNKTNPNSPEEIALHEVIDSRYDLNTVYSNGMVVSQTFNCLKKSLGRILGLGFIIALAVSAFYYFILNDSDAHFSKFTILHFFDYSKKAMLYLVNSISFSILFHFLVRMISRNLSLPPAPWLQSFLKTLFWVSLINLFFFLSTWLACLLLFIILPYLTQWYIDAQISKRSFLQSFSFGLKTMDTAPNRAYGFLIISIFISLVTFYILNTPFISFITEVIQWNLAIDESYSRIILRAFSIFMPVFTLFLVLPLFIFGHVIQYFSLREIYTAEGLANKIAQLKSGL